MRGRRGRDRNPNYVGRERETGTESLILWLVVLESLAVRWWLPEAQGLI